MTEQILQSFFQYYGLDWLAFATGMTGMTLITRKSRWGFILCAISSLSGFTVAFMSAQFGYVVYNLLLASIMMKGYFDWDRIPEKIEVKNINPENQSR
ncbi:MAG: nicotinamide mononucleotide transporter [Alphaproteobacteria bacterium]